MANRLSPEDESHLRAYVKSIEDCTVYPGQKRLVALLGELDDARQSRDWAFQRLDMLQKLQAEGMPEPWRTIVCNVLANGMYAHDSRMTPRQAIDFYENNYCEHGIREGDWCERCNQDYKDAAADPDNMRT